jgi:hypothetical protein
MKILIDVLKIVAIGIGLFSIVFVVCILDDWINGDRRVKQQFKQLERNFALGKFMRKRPSKKKVQAL